MFLNIDNHSPQTVALRHANGETMTYGQLCDFAQSFSEVVKERCVIFILCQNTKDAVAAFYAALETGVVPLLLPADMDKELLRHQVESYRPSYIWLPKDQLEDFKYPEIFEQGEYVLVQTGFESYPLYDDLSLLLTTSGSTGSPKLVRHCYENVNATARNVAKAFDLQPDEKTLASLPMHFTQGLSTITSTLLVGGEVLLTKANMMQPEFWTLLEEATSVTGVPYSYEVLCKMRFLNREWPNLRIINEGGGKLPTHRFEALANYAAEHNLRFIATYGSTETTSRMAFLNPSLAQEKTCSIGDALPEGSIDLIADDGTLVPVGEIGELVYSGPNVTLGYATCIEDLTKGDERHGVYHTGDLAYRDQDGCVFITGRKNRFLKIFGFRVGLDEVESLVKNEFKVQCACVGTDKKLIVYIVSDSANPDLANQICSFLSSKLKLLKSVFEVRFLKDLPKNAAGKTQYRDLPVE